MLSYTERSSCPHLINRAWLWQIIGNQADLVFCRVDLGYKWACRWAIGGPHMRKQIRYVEGCHLTLRWAALQGLWLSLVVAAFCSTWIFVLNECELYWERLLSETVGDRLISLYTHTHSIQIWFAPAKWPNLNNYCCQGNCACHCLFFQHRGQRDEKKRVCSS